MGPITNKMKKPNTRMIWKEEYRINRKLANGPGVARGHPPATHECLQKISGQSVQPNVLFYYR